MASIVRSEFENNMTCKVQHDVGNINPIDMDEFLTAIALIKTDKATSNDCTTDYIIKQILASKND